MNKIKIGIPRALYYYESGSLYKKFFERLGFDVIISPKTNFSIFNNGNLLAVDEMCLSMKIFLGHIDYLKDKCDYIVIPRIDNYGISNQTCTNFLAIYDICNNLFDIKILNYNIDYENNFDEIDGFIKMADMLNIDSFKALSVYEKVKEEVDKENKKKIIINRKKLKNKDKKVLILSHNYNLYDELIGKPIIKFLEKESIKIIFPNISEEEILLEEAKKFSKDLYWKTSKILLGAFSYLKDKVDGVIFLTSFPCALDSLAFELAMRKTKLPYLNLVVDNLNGFAGIETRLESFIDVLRKDTYV